MWWRRHGGVPEFKGLKVSIDDRACREFGCRWLVTDKSVKGDSFNPRHGYVGWGSNGGFNALNFAAHLEPRRIILVGFDMTVKHGVHWHGPHEGLGNPVEFQVERWIRAVDGAAKPIRRMGVEVVNSSSISRLENYRKMAFLEAIESSGLTLADARPDTPVATR